MNLGQKTSPDGMQSEQQAHKTNMGQKTLLFHSDGEHSIDVLTFLSPLKTNQFHQRMMMFQSAYQVNVNNNNDLIIIIIKLLIYTLWKGVTNDYLSNSVVA